MALRLNQIQTRAHWQATKTHLKLQIKCFSFECFAYTTFKWLMSKKCAMCLFFAIAYTFFILLRLRLYKIQLAKTKANERERRKGEKYHTKNLRLDLILLLTHRLWALWLKKCAIKTVSVKVCANIDTVQIFDEEIKIRLWINWLSKWMASWMVGWFVDLQFDVILTLLKTKKWYHLLRWKMFEKEKQHRNGTRDLFRSCMTNLATREFDGWPSILFHFYHFSIWKCDLNLN